MDKRHGRFGWLPALGMVALVLGLVAIALAAVLTLVGIISPPVGVTAWQRAAMAVALVAELALAVGLLAAYGALVARAASAASLDTLNAHMNRLETILNAAREQLEYLSDLAPLSDQAKAMIYREREIEAVQEIVNSCLLKQDYAQADKLIDRMDAQFGYHLEADRLRRAVAASREATLEGKIAAAVERVNQIIAARNWDRAAREAQRLLDAYGDDPRVTQLPDRLAEARDRHKGQLLRSYDEAVRSDNIDRSIELLRELDRYLSPQEAAALAETARGVFRAKLHNLGVQFALAVTEKEWTTAVAVGEEIVRDYPNSKMAMEVRQRFEALRQLTGGQQ